MTGTDTPRRLIGNRYELRQQLGGGAMGTVHRALDRLTGQEVALKQVMVPADQIQVSGGTMAGTIDTFDPRLALANEFKVLASLRHPNVISVLDYGFDERRPCFTMTLLEGGQTVFEAGGNQTQDAKVDLLMQLLQALAYVHRRGIIHRDLKPANVLVKDGHLYVLDFGLAADRDHIYQGEAVGTLTYIAPEVLVGGMADRRADLYAVGVIAFQLFSGELPFKAGTIQSLINEIVRQPVDLSSLDVSEALRDVLARLLSKKSDDRFDNAQAVMRALSEATGYPVPEETAVIRESYLQAAEFVGRETELSELIGALQGLVYGSAARMDRLWLVGGESGVGKSRLVDELRTRALVEGALVLQGQAVADGGLSYQLLRDVVRRLVLLVEPEPEELPALRLVVPDIDRLLDRPANGNGSVDVAAQRERLPLVIERMLTAVAAERPVLFIGEDLQWAAESLPVLNHLSKFAANGRLMILGTYRDDERPNLPSELPGMRVMRLTRLAAEEIAKLSAAMLGEAGQRDQVVSLLERETEGNVFFVVEVVRALAEEAGGLGFVGQATLPQQVFAGGIQRIVARRLDAVPDWARSALHLAAVIGRQVDPALMRDAMPKLEIDVWLRLCVDVAVFEAQEDRYRFAHDRLRESVLNRLSEAEQVSLHQQAAESIETIYAESLDEYAVVLARHWAAARDTEREGRYAALAARKAWHLNEYRDSRAFYQRALELKTYDRENDPAKALADLTYGLGRACYGLSDYRESRTHQDAALVMYREQGDEAGIGLALAALGELDMRQGKNRDAQPQVEESLAIHRKLGDRRQEAYNLMNLGVLSAQLSEFARARDYFEQCHAVMQELDEPIGLARALNNLGVINDMQGDIDAATTYYERSLEIRRQINDRQGIAYSLTNLSALAMDRDDFELARNYQAESLSLLRQVGEKLAVANAAGNLSNSLRELGELDEAERLQHESLSLRRDIGDPGSISISLVSMGQIRQKRGDIEAAKRYFHEALATVRQSEEHARLVGTIHTIARFIQNQGDKRRGVELLAFVRKQNQEMGIAGRDTEAHLAELAGQLVSHVYEDAVARGEAQEMDTVVEALLATLANGQGS